MGTFGRFLTIALWLLASGCAGHMAELSPKTSFDEDDRRAIIVFRVIPRAWVVLEKGRYDVDGWRSKGLSSRTQFWPENGFVVAKVSRTGDDEAYAITEVRPERSTNLTDEAVFIHAAALWSPAGHGAGVPGLLPAMVADVAKRVTECPAYIPKGEARLPTFEAVAGQVTYLGAIRVDAAKDSKSKDPPKKIGITPIASASDAEAVARFVAKQYPKVRAKLTTGVLRMMRRNEYTD
jgi:hypothetical protein